VLFLHRPDYYRPNDRKGAIEVIVGKGREIRTGQVIYLRNRFDVMRADEWNGEFPVEPEDKLPLPSGAPRGFDDGGQQSGRERAAGPDR
jgi:replicative DNA helicase